MSHKEEPFRVGQRRMWTASMPSRKSPSVQKGAYATGILCLILCIQRTVVSSGQTKLSNCFTSWPHGKILKIIPPDLIGISLSVSS
ncbi:hypothetical protein TNCV_221131 [Trichonephila clavipes]|nr:hypothetical protein TNCV_221131 [Trichonephila clavipes]